MLSNPFFYGNPVPCDQFVGRRRELRHVVGRILNHGQSTAVVGEPRVGKTSLLDYLAAPQNRADLYDEWRERLAFAYLDGHTLGEDFDPAQFWTHALRPIYEAAVVPDLNSPLAQAYNVCRENAFGTFVLERFFAELHTTDWRLVVMVDEFDMVLHHPVLNSAEFLGGLRALASRSRGALALVLASRQALSALNSATQQLSRTGSPYFNFLSEVTLGPLGGRDCADLLDCADARFTAADRRLISAMAGNHPYLLQVAAGAMWDAYADGDDDAYERWQHVAARLHDEVALTLSDTWRLWQPEVRAAFTAVALPHIAHTLKVAGHRFNQRRLLRGARDLGRELRELEKRGFVVAADEEDGDGWHVRPLAAQWWMAEEIARATRGAIAYEDWLRQQEFHGLLTREANEWFKTATQNLRTALQDGAKSLMEATVQGWVQGVTGAGG